MAARERDESRQTVICGTATRSRDGVHWPARRFSAPHERRDAMTLGTTLPRSGGLALTYLRRRAYTMVY
jgi:hypothetical protein